MKRLNKITYLIVLYIIFGSALVFLRPVHADEGFYMLAARNILDGQLLYVDFVYTHPPILPYFYSPLLGFGFFSYVLLRYVSFLLTLGVIVMVYLHVLKITGEKTSANFATMLIIFNGLFMDLSEIAKMYPLVNILFYSCFLCVTLLMLNISRKYPLLCFLSGLFAGSAANTRISFLFPTFIVFLVLAYKFYKSNFSFKKSLLYLSFFAGGALVPCLLSIYFLYYYPDYFLYGIFKHNLDAETIKWESGSNLLVWLKFFLLPQTVILMMFLIICLKFRFANKGFTYLIIITLLLMNSLGYSVKEYNMVIIPFAAFVCGVNYVRLKEVINNKYKFVMNSIIAIYMISILLGIPHFKHLLASEKLDPNLIGLKKIVDYERSLPGQYILSSWDVFSLFSNKKKILKNDMLYANTDYKTTPNEIKKYSMPDFEKLEGLIRDKFFDVIILHDTTPYILLKHKETIESNYTLNKVFDNIQIYTRY